MLSFYEAPQTEAVSYDSGSDAQAQADAAYQKARELPKED